MEGKSHAAPFVGEFSLPFPPEQRFMRHSCAISTAFGSTEPKAGGIIIRVSGFESLLRHRVGAFFGSTEPKLDTAAVSRSAAVNLRVSKYSAFRVAQGPLRLAVQTLWVRRHGEYETS